MTLRKILMEKTVLRKYDLNPDGVRVIVDWEDMEIGMSIFVPCVNTEKAKDQIKAFFYTQTWDYLLKVRIEGGKLGVRVWRTI